jgi:SH3 domain-containing protein
MEIRHNTNLLEFAINEEIRKAAIPSIEAEASVNERLAKASALRRLATGFAVGLAAVGVGWGVSLAWPDFLKNSLSVEHTPTFTEKQIKETTTEKLNDGTASNVSESFKPFSVPVPPKKITQQSTSAEVVTRNFNIFQNREVRLQGRQWGLKAGHFFEDEKDKNWKHAWCYTTANVGGVSVSIDLAKIASPTSKIEAPVATKETLEHVKLSEMEAYALASKCPWIGASFGSLFRYKNPAGRNNPFNPEFAKIDLVGRVLHYRGAIDEKFPNKISAYDFDTLSIDSMGGLVASAIKGGNWLRSRGKNVTVNNRCLSSCVFVLSGGVQRLASRNAKIGVHRFYSSTSSNQLVDPGKFHKDINSNIAGVEIGQAVSSEVLKYLEKMGIDSQLFHEMARTPSSSIKILTHSNLLRWQLLTGTQEKPSNSDPSSAIAEQPSVLPQPQNGLVRHSRGSVPLKVSTNLNAVEVGRFSNGTAVSILSREGNWYRVRVGNQLGFMHNSWLKVGEYVKTDYYDNFIQIKSFENLFEVEAFAKSFPLKVDAYMATNGWYAITLRETYSEQSGKQILSRLKRDENIPGDSILTNGNNFVVKVCCKL